MNIRKPKLSSAAYILRKRLQDQGLTITHAQALEHAAAMEGFQSYQAYLAHQKILEQRDAPYLQQEAVDEAGSDYVYVGPRNGSVWIRMRNISVYVKDCDEGVAVDLFNSGMEDQGSEAGTWHLYREAAAAQLEQAQELDDTKDHIKAYCKKAGVEVFEDIDQPGLWCWKHGKEGCDMSLPTEWDAWQQAYEQLF